MKKILKIFGGIFIVICLAIIITVILVSVFSAYYNFTDDFKRSLPKCEDKAEYVYGDFGDFIKYSEFYYSDENLQKFGCNSYFKKVTAGDKEKIRGYFDHYKLIVKMSDFYDKYKFDTSQIKAGDFYYIHSLEGEPIGDSVYGKYDNYNVYYVDVEKRIMYFIHSNI